MEATKALDPRAMHKALTLGRAWLRAAMYRDEHDLNTYRGHRGHVDTCIALEAALAVKGTQLDAIDAAMDACLELMPDSDT